MKTEMGVGVGVQIIGADDIKQGQMRQQGDATSGLHSEPPQLEGRLSRKV